MPYRNIQADISFLIQYAPVLVLDTNASAGATSITVKSITGVTTNTLLLFRKPGNEHAEIIATHAVTAPSGNTVTLVAAGLVEAHPAGTEVYVILYNQVRFYRAATAVNANSDDSTLSALAAAQAIDPTTVVNVYSDSSQTSGYYYYRFINSVASINGLYSDPVPWAARGPKFAEDTVGYLLDFTKRKLKFQWTEQFSVETAIDEINSCLRFMQGKLKHWSKYLVTNAALGQTARGVYSYALSGLSTEIYNDETNKSVLNVRISNTDLIWKDEKEFDDILDGVKHTTVRTQPNVGDTSLNVVNSYDFDSTGTIDVFTSNTDDAITYTGVTRSTTVGVFTGVPASGASSIEATHAVGTNVWQDHSEGQPKYFHINAGTLYIWPLPSADWINKNVVIDYWSEATAVDSESDTIDTDRWDGVKHWVLWQAKNYLRNNGNQDLKDGDYATFKEILNDQIRREVSGQKFKMKPKINQVIYRPVVTQDFDKS